MTTDRLSSNREVLLQIQELKLSIEQGQGSQTLEPREVKHKQLLQYLAPIGPETIHSKALSEHQLGTSNWSTEGPLQQFLNISDKQGAILWLKGKSGSGKTTLLAYVIEYLRSQPQVARVLPFYCSLDNSNLQTLSNILGSFIAQLSYDVPAILEELVAKAEARKSKAQESSFSAMELEKVLIKHVPAKGLTYLVLDAVNESEISTELETFCYRLAASCPNLRIIVSSTSDWSLSTDPSVIHFSAQMSTQDFDNDICVYIDRRLKFDKTLSSAMLSVKWIILRLNELVEGPLKLQELADAVVVEDGDDPIGDGIRLHDPMILLEHANGLFEFNPVTQAVSLSHSSIKTFLTSDWIKNSSASYFALGRDTECHLKIMRWCLTYLSYSEFNSGCGVISKSTMSRYPFLGYAAWNWPYHLRNPSTRDWEAVSAFLSTRNSKSGGNYGCWMHVLNQRIHPETLKETQPFYYAASFGFSPLVESMLLFDDNLDLEAPGGSVGSTALQVACFRHQKEVARMLIEAGADFLSRDGSFPNGRGLTSLWWAEANGWVDIVDLMTSKMTQKKIAAAPEGTYPIKYIQEVQKADAKKRKQILEGGPAELLDKKLVATEFPRYHIPKSKMERFVEERLGKGNFLIDVLLQVTMSGTAPNDPAPGGHSRELDQTPLNSNQHGQAQNIIDETKDTSGRVVDANLGASIDATKSGNLSTRVDDILNPPTKSHVGGTFSVQRKASEVNEKGFKVGEEGDLHDLAHSKQP
ncbi:NACHT nucleoside triphosphatase [Fusarium napiforme]|uniref:NACHT nucleoside triphosphatase n=1 Tax=Fusarium napiforme TaxID=42672 RepID=A0A8H5K5R9_9HYPO|nr:NACHT nucleoside triphosphatase [Fusarium napiforme]